MSISWDFTDKPDLPENHALLSVHTFHVHILYYGYIIRPPLSAVVIHAIYHLKWIILNFLRGKIFF